MGLDIPLTPHPGVLTPAPGQGSREKLNTLQTDTARPPADGEDEQEPYSTDGDTGTQHGSLICQQAGPWPRTEPLWPWLPQLRATHTPSHRMTGALADTSLPDQGRPKRSGALPGASRAWQESRVRVTDM